MPEVNALAKYTCDACLFHRGICKGKGCARWEKRKAEVIRKHGLQPAKPQKRAPRPYVSNGRRRGRPSLPTPIRDAIAWALINDERSGPDIAKRAGVSYNQVRTVLQNLRVLNGGACDTRGRGQAVPKEAA
jgi:hypothetical protein